MLGWTYAHISFDSIMGSSRNLIQIVGQIYQVFESKYPFWGDKGVSFLVLNVGAQFGGL